MFNSFVVKLQASEKNTLRDVSKNLYSYFEQLLNDKNSYFSVSPFFKHSRYNLELEEGKFYLFKVSTLDTQTFSIFISTLFRLKILNEFIKVDNCEFIVKDIICDENQSKYAKRFDNDRFRYINSDDCDIYEYKLSLISPTIFKIGSQFYNDISAEMIFRNLINKFNKYSIYEIDKSIIKDLVKCKVIINNEKISNVKIDKSICKCIKCDIDINFKDLDKKVCKIIRTLIEFSVYSGVGYKSELGFGHVIML